MYSMAYSAKALFREENSYNEHESVVEGANDCPLVLHLLCGGRSIHTATAIVQVERRGEREK